MDQSALIYLQTSFTSIQNILAEMRSIHCIEHAGKLIIISPLVRQHAVVPQVVLQVPQV